MEQILEPSKKPEKRVLKIESDPFPPSVEQSESVEDAETRKDLQSLLEDPLLSDSDALNIVANPEHTKELHSALQSIDTLSDELTIEVLNPEKVKTLLRDVMAKMHEVVALKKADEKQAGTIALLLQQRFEHIVRLKKGTANTEIQQAYSDIFHEFNDLIEDEFVATFRKQQEASNKPFSVTSLIEKVYGRSRAEVEKIKKENRENVASEIMKRKDKPYVTNEDILALTAIYNKGITPKNTHRYREEEGEFVGYGGKRLGIIPEDVKEEMKEFEERVAKVIDMSLIENWSDARYEIAVAQLHNEFIDIHPLLDRNGSTGLLFMELMMARRGYIPPTERGGNYYNQVRQILGNNPVAIGCVGHEMYKMTHEVGYFDGSTTKKPNKPRLYDVLLKGAGFKK